MHTCHALDCDVPVPPRMFMCKPHWFTLPKYLRDAVLATYRPGQEQDKRPSPAYLMAAQTAVHWMHVKENKPGKLCLVCIEKVMDGGRTGPDGRQNSILLG